MRKYDRSPCRFIRPSKTPGGCIVWTMASIPPAQRIKRGSTNARLTISWRSVIGRLRNKIAGSEALMDRRTRSVTLLGYECPRCHYLLKPDIPVLQWKLDTVCPQC